MWHRAPDETYGKVRGQTDMCYGNGLRVKYN